VSIIELTALDLDATPSSPWAVCVLEGGELWTSSERKHREQAAELCQACPILVECRQAALDRGERWGTWGGRDLETEYRKREPRKLRTTAPCGTPSGYKRHLRRREPACEACLASRRQQPS
jgi:hypothetical protein